MALTPSSDTVLIQEVDDAVRRDKMQALARSYGVATVAAILIALLAYGGWLFWQHRQAAAADTASEQMIDALRKLDNGDTRGAAPVLKALSTSDNQAYRAAAGLTTATVASRGNDVKAAVAALSVLAADEDLDPVLRDVALVRQTVLEYDTLKPEAVIARLQPIVSRTGEDASPLFASAAELTALAHYRLGQMKQAGTLFARIGQAEGTPDTLKSRVTQMAGTLGVDAVASDAGGPQTKGAAAAAKGATAAPAAPTQSTK